MNKSAATEPEARAKRWCSVWVTAILTITAAFALGYGAMLAPGRADTEPLESPLVMSVARQLVASPWELYGPFDRQNPWVLIHAPLYYRISAVAAWLIARTGVDPVLAALAGGRIVSMLGLAVTLAVAFRMARLAQGSARAGWWAVLLVAAAPVVSTQPYSVRPDMIGIALQTTGLFLVWTALYTNSRRGLTVAAAFAAFALAVCVKQHFVVVPAISTLLLLVAWRRQRGGVRLVGCALLVALAIVILVYSAEEVASTGRMSRAILGAASQVSRIHPADWVRVEIVFLSITGRSAGLIVLLMASALCLIESRPTPFRRVLVVVGTCCIVVAVALEGWSLVSQSEGRIAIRAMALIAAPVVILPVCGLVERRSLAGGKLDSALWLYIAGELSVVVLLARASTGAWVNYAIQAVVLACILTARGVDRALDGAASLPALAPIAVAVLVIPTALTLGTYPDFVNRSYDRAAEEYIFDYYKRPRYEYFFVDRPGTNRLDGRIDLVYDDWLYPVFESTDLAEPRSIWLYKRLTDGSVRFVVNTSADAEIPGLGATLPRLGYVSRIQVGPFFVWERIGPVVPSSGRR